MNSKKQNQPVKPHNLVRAFARHRQFFTDTNDILADNLKVGGEKQRIFS